MKRTYQSNIKKRLVTHGFMARNNNSLTRKILASRRKKGRKFLTVSDRNTNKGRI